VLKNLSERSQFDEDRQSAETNPPHGRNGTFFAPNSEIEQPQFRDFWPPRSWGGGAAG